MGNNLTIPIPDQVQEEIKSLFTEMARDIIQEVKGKEAASKDFMRLNEACAWLGISYLTMRKWQQQGLKCIEIDGIKLLSKETLLQFLKDHEK